MAGPTTIPDIPSLQAYVGSPLGPSDWFTITQEQIQDFARATGDHQWIHTDIERAEKESPFGGPIAHGYLTMSLAPALLPQLLQVSNASRTINYGIDKMRRSRHDQPDIPPRRIEAGVLYRRRDLRLLPLSGVSTRNRAATSALAAIPNLIAKRYAPAP